MFRNLDQPGELIVLFDWSKEDYGRFMADPETPGIMKAAGLAGPPETIEVERWARSARSAGYAGRA